MAEKGKGERRRESSETIMALAKVLSDEQRLSQIGSRLVRMHLEGLVAERLGGGGIGPISWSDVWVDANGWGTDVWENSWASDFWDDALRGRVARPGGPDDYIELQAVEAVAAPEEVFSAEEIQVLTQLQIIGG